MKEELLNIVRESLLEITNPRFFETERGFQGMLLHKIQSRLSGEAWAGAIVEQEYPKKLKEHGLRIRPDLIIHVPFNPEEHKSRREDNFAVIELKLRANKERAIEDYNHLSNMCNELDYPLALFINLGSSETFFDEYAGNNKDKMVAIGVELLNGAVRLTEYTT